MSKKITIQLWTDLYYCRVIGIWYPEIVEIDTEPTYNPTTLPSTSQRVLDTVNAIKNAPNDAPQVIVLSSMFEPRQEVMGNNPVASGQHPMPKDFIEKQIRHMSYLFANEFGMFQPHSKAAFKTFIAKNTFSYNMDKEIDIEVSPATGSITLRDLRNSIDQYTEEQQQEMLVLTVGEHPRDAKSKGIDQYIYEDRASQQEQYISITKLMPVYETENAYIKTTSLPEDPALMIVAPGTEDADMSQLELAKTVEAIDTDTREREALEMFDELGLKEIPVLDDEGLPVLTEEGLPVTEKSKPDRIAVLEAMIEKKNSQLVTAGVIKPTLPVKEDDELLPLSEAEIFPVINKGDE